MNGLVLTSHPHLVRSIMPAAPPPFHGVRCGGSKNLSFTAGFWALCQIVTYEGERLAIYRRSADGQEWPDSPIEIDRVETVSEGVIRLRDLPDRALFPHPALIIPQNGPPGARGRSLWEALTVLFNSETRQAILTTPGLFSPESFSSAIEDLFALEAQQRIVIAGKEAPARAGATYQRIRASEASSWDFGVVTDTATPRLPGTVATYVNLRVFNPEEWAALQETTADTPAKKTKKQPRGNQDQSSGAKSSDEMLLALDELLAAGSAFRDVKIAHSAVLRKLEIKDAARGYSYKTFHRIAAGRLKRP